MPNSYQWIVIFFRLKNGYGNGNDGFYQYGNGNNGLDTRDYRPLKEFPKRFAKSAKNMLKEDYTNHVNKIFDNDVKLESSQNENHSRLPSLYERSNLPIEYQHISKEDGNNHPINKLHNHQLKPALSQYIQQDQQLKQEADHGGMLASNFESTMPIEYQHNSKVYGKKHSRNEFKNHQMELASDHYSRKDEQLKQEVDHGGVPSSDFESRSPIEYEHIPKVYGKEHLKNEFKSHQMKSASGQYVRKDQELEHGVDLGRLPLPVIITPKQTTEVWIIFFAILIVGSIIAFKLARPGKTKKYEKRGSTISPLPDLKAQLPYNSNEHLRDDSVRYRRKFSLEQEQRYEDILRRATKNRPSGRRSEIVEQQNSCAVDDVMETIGLESVHRRSNIGDKIDVFPYEDPFSAPEYAKLKKRRLSVGDFVKQCSTLSLFRRENENSNDKHVDDLKKDKTARLSDTLESEEIGVDSSTGMDLRKYDSIRALVIDDNSSVDISTQSQMYNDGKMKCSSETSDSCKP